MKINISEKCNLIRKIAFNLMFLITYKDRILTIMIFLKKYKKIKKRLCFPKFNWAVESTQI